MPKALPFTKESARAAAQRSAAVRQAKQPKTVAEKALEDLLALKVLLQSILAAGPCAACHRSGPKTTAESVDIVKTLLALNSEILNRLKGKPPTESSAQRFGSVEEYKKATQALDASDCAPDDLPEPPSD